MKLNESTAVRIENGIVTITQRDMFGDKNVVMLLVAELKSIQA